MNRAKIDSLLKDCNLAKRMRQGFLVRPSFFFKPEPFTTFTLPPPTPARLRFVSMFETPRRPPFIISKKISRKPNLSCIVLIVLFNQVCVEPDVNTRYQPGDFISGNHAFQGFAWQADRALRSSSLIALQFACTCAHSEHA